MGGRLLIALAIVAVVVAGVGAGIALNKHTTTSTQPEAGTQGAGGPQGAGKGHGGPGGGGGGAGGGTSEAGANCTGIGNLTVGQAINWLFSNHDKFRFNYKAYPDNKTIVWIIIAPNKTAATILANHIRQMECILEHGGNPRPHDPLFRLEANVSKYVTTEIYWINDTTLKIVKHAENECAFEAIKLHAEVVRGFFTVGREEARITHNVPDNVKQLCAPYLNTTIGAGG